MFTGCWFHLKIRPLSVLENKPNTYELSFIKIPKWELELLCKTYCPFRWLCNILFSLFISNNSFSCSGATFGWDNITVRQLSKLSFFPAGVLVFHPRRLNTDPNNPPPTPQSVKLNCYSQFFSAHNLLPACYNLPKLSLGLQRGQRVILFSKESVSRMTIFVQTNNSCHFPSHRSVCFSPRILPHWGWFTVIRWRSGIWIGIFLFYYRISEVLLKLLHLQK